MAQRAGTQRLKSTDGGWSLYKQVYLTEGARFEGSRPKRREERCQRRRRYTSTAAAPRPPIGFARRQRLDGPRRRRLEAPEAVAIT